MHLPWSIPVPISWKLWSKMCYCLQFEIRALVLFYYENLKGRDQLEDLGVDGKIILEWILTEIGREGVNWLCLAQVMKFLD
jgi:hypothetical protein